MSVFLKRHATLETMSLEEESGVDGQGMPSYASAVDIDAFVVRSDEVVRTINGEEVKVFATAHVDAEQSVLPEFNHRVTLADGTVAIVVMREDVKNLQRGAVDHVELKLRRA